MNVKAISFTAKTPKVQNTKAYKKAIEEALGQSDRDYFSMTKKTKSQPQTNQTDFIETAKKFFSNMFGQ